ncbi:MAG: hypothetical protein FWC72_08485 [Oscillospiraceae bacterium]|nr:hypothetical protein [Oscillospiraceae bacterium]
MRRHGPEGKKRIATILICVGAVMVVALMLPWWFWWLSIGLGFLCGGIWLLRK